MPAHNPYAPSSASLKVGEEPGSPGGIWRDEKRGVIVAHGTAFPHRCVKCNQPSLEPHKMRKVYWHHPALYLLFLFNVFIYLLVALIVRKKAQIDPGLCEEHSNRRRLWIAIGWIGALGGPIVMAIAGGALGVDPVTSIGVAFLCFLGFAVAGVVKSRILHPRKIDERYARLKGADERFLASLPNFLTY